MKKIFAFAVLLISLFTVCSGNFSAAKAEEPIIKIQLKNEDVLLPIIKTDGEFSYKIFVYSAADEERKNPLSSGKTTYRFESVGQYDIVYNIEKSGGVTEQVVKKVEVRDETPPVIKELALKKQYLKGDTISLKFYATDDSLYEPTLLYGLTKNGKDYTDKIKGSVFVPDESGKYVFTYSAADKAGNKTELTATFTVSEGKSAVTTVVIIICCAAALIVAVVVVAIVIVKRRKNKI